jgi:phytoene synthase
VAEGLAACVETKPEIAPIVRDMLDARDADMEERPFTDEAAFRSYLDATAGGLIRASWALLGHRDDEAARVLGEAWGRVGLLRALPVHARSRRLMMPEEVVNAHGGDAEALFSARWGEAERAALADLHAKAVTAWQKARRVFPTVPTHARPAVLYVALVPGLLKGLSDPSPRALLTTQPGPRRLRMMWAALRGRV